MDTQEVCSPNLEDTVPIYIAIFYVFNIKYVDECQDLFDVLEYVFLNKQPSKKTTSFISQLS